MARLAIALLLLGAASCGGILGVTALDAPAENDAGVTTASGPTSPTGTSPPSSDDDDVIPSIDAGADCSTTVAHLPGAAGESGDGEAWAQPGNIEKGDDIGATNTLSASIVNGAVVTQLLEATQFGFTIPAGATVTGVTFGVRAQGLSGGIARDRAVQLVGVPDGGANLASLGLFYGSEYAERTYGGDDWGLPLTPDMVNDPGFGVGISLQRALGTPDEPVWVDVMSLAVTYCQ